jgi:hypothetical protein
MRACPIQARCSCIDRLTIAVFMYLIGTLEPAPRTTAARVASPLRLVRRLVDVVKPNYNPNPGEPHIFGESTALSGTGKTLIVAVPRESSTASGIGGGWASTGRANSGAIFMC